MYGNDKMMYLEPTQKGVTCFTSQLCVQNVLWLLCIVQNVLWLVRIGENVTWVEDGRDVIIRTPSPPYTML